MKFEILASLQNNLNEVFEKLNRKCRKYGNEELSYVVLRSFEKDYKFWLEIEVSGCTPKIGNYELVSVISKLADGTNIVYNVPGNSTPEQFRSTDFYCDHCQTNRYRKEVVIVKDENGNYIQLGKTCLRDYLSVSLENLVHRFTYIYEVIQSLSNDDNYPREELVANTKFFLERAAICIRKLGFVSAKKASEENVLPTKSLAWELCFPKYSTERFMRENDLYLNESDVENVRKSIEWLESNTDNSDFIYNLKSIVKQDYTTYRNIGFLAALIPSYLKATTPKTNNSDFIGNIGEKLDIVATCVTITLVETYYGVTRLHKFVDENGNNITWFSSGNAEFDINQKYHIKFTVKKHDLYKNQKQTLVTRVKCLS